MSYIIFKRNQTNFFFKHQIDIFLFSSFNFLWYINFGNSNISTILELYLNFHNFYNQYFFVLSTFQLHVIFGNSLYNIYDKDEFVQSFIELFWGCSPKNSNVLMPKVRYQSKIFSNKVCFSPIGY